MADFARVLAAADDVCGTDGLSRFGAKARSLAEDSLDADPFLTALRRRLEQTFEGTAVGNPHRVTPRMRRDARRGSGRRTPDR